MFRTALLLLLTDCASVGPAPVIALDDGGGVGSGEIGPTGTGDLSMTGPGADLSMAGQPDLGGWPDLGPPPGGYPYPRVNEVVASAGGVPANEYVELIGASDHDIDLSGWSLHQETSTGALRLLLTLNSIPLPRGQYVLIAADAGSYGGMAEQTYASGTTGKIAQAAGAIALLDPGGTRVDSLGWGTANGGYVEGTAAPDPADLSVGRIPDGVDTNNNHADAKKSAITPKAPNHL